MVIVAKVKRKKKELSNVMGKKVVRRKSFFFSPELVKRVA